MATDELVQASPASPSPARLSPPADMSVSSRSSTATLSPPIIPNPLPLINVARRWGSFSNEVNPLTTLSEYVQDLILFEVGSSGLNEFAPPPNITLCPFLLENLQPYERIIPHVPLYLNNCPGYVFFLLYVFKQTEVISTASRDRWTAVFHLIHPGEGRAALVGADCSIHFVHRVEVNIRTERLRIERLASRVPTRI